METGAIVGITVQGADQGDTTTIAETVTAAAEELEAVAKAVCANRRRIHGARGLARLRRRSEYLERPNAHLYETGRMRRTHLRGHANILKRLIVHTGGFNLGLLMRTFIGIGRFELLPIGAPE